MKPDNPRFQVTFTLRPAVEISAREALAAPGIFMIKLVRRVTGLPLKESKELFEQARGFNRSEFADQDSFDRRLTELVHREFKFTSPALYTRQEVYQMVSHFTNYGTLEFSLGEEQETRPYPIKLVF